MGLECISVKENISVVAWLLGSQLVAKLVCVYQLKFQKGSRFENEFILNWLHSLYYIVNPPVLSKAVQLFNAKKYITFWGLRIIRVQEKVRSTPLPSPQNTNVWSVFPLFATLPPFIMGYPGCFQIKWISCFGTLRNLGSKKLENEGKWMIGLILFCVGFLFTEQILTNNVSLKFWGFFLSSSFNSLFPLPLLLVNFLETIWTNFESI